MELFLHLSQNPQHKFEETAMQTQLGNMSPEAPSPLQGRISSDLVTLNALNMIYPWLPNAHTIRPDAIVLERKRRLIDQIGSTWRSMRDYILCAVFRATHTTAEGRHAAVEYGLPTDTWTFAPSLFPYNLLILSKHWILWNRAADYSASFDDTFINQLLHTKIARHIGHTHFQFGWYKNPNPSIQDFWHIQVFWTED